MIGSTFVRRAFCSPALASSLSSSMHNLHLEGIGERLERQLILSANCDSYPIQLSSGSRQLLLSLSQQEARLASHLLLDTNSDDLPDTSASSHPAVKLFRGFVQQQQQPNAVPSTQRLLIALIANHINSKYPHLATERMRDAQRQVAEIVQLLHVSQLLHRRLLNLDGENDNDSEDPEMLSISPVHEECESNNLTVKQKQTALHHGNKLAVLGGDLLFTLAIRLMADLRNQTITERVTHTVHEQARASFALQSGLMTTKALSLPNHLGYRVWARLQLQLSVTNLQNGCRSLLALLPNDTPQLDLTSAAVIQFARYFAYAMQISLERRRILCSFSDPEARLRLLSAPVLLDGINLDRLLLDRLALPPTISVHELIPHLPNTFLPISFRLVQSKTQKASACLKAISVEATSLHDLLTAVERF